MLGCEVDALLLAVATESWLTAGERLWRAAALARALDVEVFGLLEAAACSLALRLAAAFVAMLVRRCLGLAAAGNAADDDAGDDDDGEEVEASELLRCLATRALDADADAPCCPAAALESALAFLLASRMSATSFL